jgi:hypothetical protein
MLGMLQLLNTSGYLQPSVTLWRPCIVLTLGSPLKKRRKKKNPSPNLGFRTSTFRTWTDEKKKPLVLTLGCPSEKGD